MKKGSCFGVGLLCFLLGLTVGFYSAPMKNGIGNNAGNTNNYYFFKKKPKDMNDYILQETEATEQ